MNQRSILLPIFLFFVLLSFPIFAVQSWTVEQGQQYTSDYSYLKINENTYSISDISNADIVTTSGGTCTFQCRQKFDNPSNVSADNYNCIGVIDGDLYQLSSGCDNLDYTYPEITTTSSTNQYLCIRNFEKQTMSRVNLTWSKVSTYVCNLTIYDRETQNMTTSYITRSPVNPVPSNDLTFLWDTGTNATIEYVYLLHEPTQWTAHYRFLVYPKTDHSLIIPAGDFTRSGKYSYNVTSCQGTSAINTSTWFNCAVCSGWFNTTDNTSSSQTCLHGLAYPIQSAITQTPITKPVNVSASIISVDIIGHPAIFDDVWNMPHVTLNEIVTIKTVIKNNGTDLYNYYIGQSFGRLTNWCDRMCYADCGNDIPITPALYGQPDCDYIRTGTMSPDQITINTRKFKFRDDFFTYAILGYPDYLIPSMTTAIYYAPYLDLNSSYDKILGFNVYIDTNKINISHVRTIPTSVLALIDDVTFTWWTSVNSSTILTIYNPDGSFHSRYTTDTSLGVDRHYVTRGKNLFSRAGNYSYNVTSCLNEPDYECQSQASSFIVIIQDEYGENQNAQDQLGNLFKPLGISATLGLYLFSFIISLITAGIIIYKTGKEFFGLISFIGLLSVFSLMGWFPFWFLVLFVIVLLLYIVNIARQHMLGTKGG